MTFAEKEHNFIRIHNFGGCFRKSFQEMEHELKLIVEMKLELEMELKLGLEMELKLKLQLQSKS